MIIGTGMQVNARIYFEASMIALMLHSFGEVRFSLPRASDWHRHSFPQSLGIAFASFHSSMGLNVSYVLDTVTRSSCIF